MAISLKHSFNCAKLDGTDTTVVQPSDWNAEHALTAAQGKVLGTVANSTAVSELPIEVDATGQSVKLPAGTTLQRPAVPDAGMTRYNTTTTSLEAYIGSAWSAFDTFPTGTKMLFQQTAAPTGWTKDTTHNNKALRVVSGTAGSGGSVSFTSAFGSQTISGTSGATTQGGTVGDTTLTVSQIPSHTHTITYGVNDVNGGGGTDPSYMERTGRTETTNATGGGESHTHTFTGDSHTHTYSSTLNLAVEYVDLIIATKN
jgi:hypothetical protein